MKRDLNTHSMNRISVSLFVFIFLILPNNVIAIEYDFEEDFSSGNGDWLLLGVDWRNFDSEGGMVINHSLSIENGRLVSNQTSNTVEGGIWDHAFHPLTLINGTWEFKAKQFNWSRSLDLAWQFELTEEDIDWEGTIPSTPVTTSLIVFFETNRITIFEEISSGSKIVSYTRTDDFIEFDTDYTYNIVKSGERLTVLINQVKVIEHTLGDISSTTFNYFGVATSKPMSFDDFKVTTDVTLGIPDDLISGSSDEKNEDTKEGLLTVNRLMIIASIATLVLLYKSLFVKKKLKI